MIRRLPPLNALPAFEAAARYLNFSRAADELNVTHGAVSRAIKHLEEQLGVLLFERATRSVRLTAVGGPYARAVHEMLDQLAAATQSATAAHSASTLNVSTSDGFAGKWLVPRLYRFHRAHGDIDVRISTTGRLTNFLGDGIDVAIRYGAGNYPGLTSEFLTGEEVFPVCSPRLMQGAWPLEKPDDLRHHTLIHDGFPIGWAAWLSSAGVEGVDPRSGITFDSATFAVESAVQGEGVVLGRTMLVAADLATGRLVRPFGHALKSVSSFYLVYPPDAVRRRKVKAFRDWLFSEMTAQGATAVSGE
ncbi:transcriptional regulator GcvA [Mesorhizobium sp. B292B1B]|uniref:transcriptional regulator GcvA n=1 Tax=unclassified Mesorhizobium TaxID=325217 RepID=UPI00112B1455|nr:MULTISPECIES: transcriptional regulator GcvA [unclassified Mesorhizobium]MCA0016138.1 transcriptional regulator GcvA [Mesorhizobium sp. B294B1A1]MCA0040088.1 transcriptional regulator GcvA [Mesorhizobium sp. B292B1B]TPM43333.1 transcriptional regulator GcvA [Mesorhizobium sp. B2-3-2]